MRRYHRQDEGQDTQRWLVSYADFITLLLAVFIVMYAVANVNLNYYKKLLKRAHLALQDEVSVKKSMLDKAKADATPMREQLRELKDKLEKREKEYRAYQQAKVKLEQLGQQLNKSLQGEIDQNTVMLHKHPDWLSIELKALFGSGSVIPQESAYALLEKLAIILRTTPNNIAVQGYTDDIPIKNSVFPSNWELSAARAAAVVRVLVDYGVEATQLSATGYGKLYPVASNETEAGRFRNRRIVILIALNARVMHALREQLDKHQRATGEKVEIETHQIKLQTGDQKIPGGVPQLPAVVPE